MFTAHCPNTQTHAVCSVLQEEGHKEKEDRKGYNIKKINSRAIKVARMAKMGNKTVFRCTDSRKKNDDLRSAVTPAHLWGNI